MALESQVEVTKLLDAIRTGDAAARDRLFAVVYKELRDMAGGLMHRERPDHTLQPSALVNEAVIRLLDQDALAKVVNRGYLFTIARRLMRQILVDHARRRSSGKQGGDWRRQPLDDVLDSYEAHKLDVCDLDEALKKLEAINERHSQIVELRFFFQMTWPEIAGQLDIAESTAKSDFQFARAWLFQRLGGTINDA